MYHLHRGCSSTGIYKSPMQPYQIASNLTNVINSSDVFLTSVLPEIVNQVVKHVLAFGSPCKSLG